MRALSLLCVLLLTACGDSSAPRITPSLSVVAGDAQVDTVTKELPQLIAVQVTDAKSDAPLASYPLNWVALNGGSVFAPVTASGSDGIARQRVTLGTGAGPQCFAARALDPETGDILVDVRSCATGMPDTAYVFRFGTHRATVTIGDSVAVTWWYEDVYANKHARCHSGYTDDAITWSATGAVASRVTNDTLWVRATGAGGGSLIAFAHCVEGNPQNGRSVDRIDLTNP